MAFIPNIEQQITANKKALSVKILSPRKEFFKGTALSVSSINSRGKFDILPEHGNFITIIEKNPIIIKQLNREDLTFIFPLAVIYTRKNIVTIFTDIQLEQLTS